MRSHTCVRQQHNLISRIPLRYIESPEHLHMSIELIKLFLQQGYEITKPGFLQMYIYDAENEVANRTVSQPGVQLDSEMYI